MDRFDRPMLELAPGVPPPDTAADLHLHCQNYAARQRGMSI
jgi:hypothetical protein